MEKKLSYLFIIILLPILTLIGNPCPKAETAPIKLSYCIFFPHDHVQAQAAMQFCREIEKRTQGKVAFSFYTGGRVQRSPHIYDGVVKGIFDMGMSCFAYSKGRFPVMEAVDLPLGYPNAQVASQAADEFAKSLNPKEIQDTKLLYVHAHGPGLLHTKRAVHIPSELKGMIIRTTGHSAKIIKAMGGTAIAMTQSEAYEALQNNLVDGTMAPISTLKGYRQAEVIDFTTQWYCIGYTTAMFSVMNLETWRSLPQEVQEVFEKLSKEWVKVHGRAWDEADQEGRNYTKKLGNKLITLSNSQIDKWQKAVQPVIEDYISNTPEGESHVLRLRKLIHKHREQ